MAELVPKHTYFSSYSTPKRSVNAIIFRVEKPNAGIEI